MSDTVTSALIMDYAKAQRDRDRLRATLHDLLENSAVITPPNSDDCFVELEVRAQDYEAAYDLLTEIP